MNISASKTSENNKVITQQTTTVVEVNIFNEVLKLCVFVRVGSRGTTRLSPTHKRGHVFYNLPGSAVTPLITWLLSAASICIFHRELRAAVNPLRPGLHE